MTTTMTSAIVEMPSHMEWHSLGELPTDWQLVTPRHLASAHEQPESTFWKELDREIQLQSHTPLPQVDTGNQERVREVETTTSVLGHEADVMPYTGQTYSPPIMSPPSTPKFDMDIPQCHHDRIILKKVDVEVIVSIHPDDDYHLTESEIIQHHIKLAEAAQTRCRQPIETRLQNRSRVLREDRDRKREESDRELKPGMQLRYPKTLKDLRRDSLISSSSYDQAPCYEYVPQSSINAIHCRIAALEQERQDLKDKLRMVLEASPSSPTNQKGKGAVRFSAMMTEKTIDEDDVVTCPLREHWRGTDEERTAMTRRLRDRWIAKEMVLSEDRETVIRRLREGLMGRREANEEQEKVTVLDFAKVKTKSDGGVLKMLKRLSAGGMLLKG